MIYSYFNSRFLGFPISTSIDITVYLHGKSFIFVKHNFSSIACYLLQATGGSGQYNWTSDVRTVATVNARGLFTTTTDTGMTEVKAHDLENPMNFSIAQVHPISIKAV